MLPLLAFVALVSADVPPIPHAELVVIDDRAVKGQGSAALLKAAAADIATRTGVTVQLASDAAKKLDAPSVQAFTACGDAACLAASGKKLAADVVVTVRVEQREGVFMVTVSRIAALAKVKNLDDTVLARTDAETLKVLPDALEKLFPSVSAKPADVKPVDVKPAPAH
jgi:hypothetical protein